jgi:hypothetical protein
MPTPIPEAAPVTKATLPSSRNIRCALSPEDNIIDKAPPGLGAIFTIRFLIVEGCRQIA